MEIFVLRHGHAEPEADRDSLRPLSYKGKQEVASSIERNLESFSNLERIVVSPYLRAQQSYEVVAESLPDIAKADSDLLIPGGNPDKLVSYLYDLNQNENVQSIMLVSHQPLVGTFIDQLCGLEPGCYRMGTASLAAIDADVVAANCASLRWLKHAE